MHGNRRRIDGRVLAKRAPTVALLLVGLLATVACGAAPQPTATSEPTPTATTQPTAASRTTCVGAGCIGASPTAMVAAQNPPTAAAPTASVAPTATTAATTTVARPTSGSATPGSGVLYRADFRTWFLGDEGGQYPLRATFDEPTGEYRLAQGDPQGGYVNYRTAPGEQRFADFQLDVDVRQLQGPGQGFFGVVFRVQPAMPGAKMIERYFLAISSDGYLTFNHIGVDGTVVRVAPRTEVPGIAKGESTNHLTVICKGTNLTVSINGHPIGTYTGPAAAAGLVGLTIGTVPSTSRPNSIEVAFSNLILSSIP